MPTQDASKKPLTSPAPAAPQPVRFGATAAGQKAINPNEDRLPALQDFAGKEVRIEGIRARDDAKTGRVFYEVTFRQRGIPGLSTAVTSGRLISQQLRDLLEEYGAQLRVEAWICQAPNKLLYLADQPPTSPAEFAEE